MILQTPKSLCNNTIGRETIAGKELIDFWIKGRNRSGREMCSNSSSLYIDDIDYRGSSDQQLVVISTKGQRTYNVTSQEFDRQSGALDILHHVDHQILAP